MLNFRWLAVFWIGLGLFLVGCGSTATESVQSTPLPTYAPDQIPSIYLYSVSQAIQANSQVTIPVRIDKITDMELELNSDGTAVKFSIEDSSGKTFVSNEAVPLTLSFPGETLPTEFKVTFTAGNLSEPATVAVQIKGKSKVGMLLNIRASTSGVTKSGKIEVTLVDLVKGKTINGANVTANLYAVKFNSPNNTLPTPIKLTLNDKGSDGDTKAGDGVYTIYIPDNLPGENIMVEATAEGSYEGGAFQRRGVEVEVVKSGSLRLSGKYNWKTYSAGVAGATKNIDKIEFEAEVLVKRAGTYRFEYSITTAEKPDGVYTDNFTRDLKEGTQNIVIPFEVSELNRLQVKPPYYLQYFRIVFLENDRSIISDELTPDVSPPILKLSAEQLGS